MSTLRTVFFMTLLTLLLVFAGRALGGPSGMVIAFVMAVVMNLRAYWFSDRIVLAMYGAREASESEAPELHSMVRELVLRAGLPMPKLYIIDRDTPNAFATGRNPEHAAVAVTAGIHRILDRDELIGVLGHELAHVKHRAILIGSIAATFAGAISMLASMAQWGLSLVEYTAGRMKEAVGVLLEPSSSRSSPPLQQRSSNSLFPDLASMRLMRVEQSLWGSRGILPLHSKSWTRRPSRFPWMQILQQLTCSS